MNRTRTLRWHLVQVLLAGILPIGAFAAALLFMHWQTQDEQRRESQMEATRLLGDGAKPVLVALTGYGSEEDARRAREAGFVHHLTKPVEVAELAAMVSRTVS